MNRLSSSDRARVIACLVEGMSQRATVRVTGIAKAQSVSSLFAALRSLLGVEGGLGFAFEEVGGHGDDGLQDGPAQQGNGGGDGEDGIGEVCPLEVAEDHGGEHDASQCAGGDLGGEFAVGLDLEEHDAHHGSTEAACHADEAEAVVIDQGEGRGGRWIRQKRGGGGDGGDDAETGSEDDGGGGGGEGHGVRNDEWRVTQGAIFSVPASFHSVPVERPADDVGKL